MKNLSFKIFLLVSFLFSIIMTTIAPYILTRSCGSIKFLEKEAHVGDTIGGTTAPIIGLISIFLLFFTLYEQRKNNIDVLRLTYRQHFKDVYMNLLNDYSSNRNKLTAVVNGCFGYQSRFSYKIDDYSDFFTEMILQIRQIFDYLNIDLFPESINYSLIETEYEFEKQNDNVLGFGDVENIPDIEERERVKEINSQYDKRIKIAFYYGYYNISKSEYDYFWKNKKDINKRMIIVSKILIRKFPQLKSYIKQVKLISEYSRISENEYLEEYLFETKNKNSFDNYYKLLDGLMTNEERLLLFYISVTNLTFFNNLSHMGLLKKINKEKIMHFELFKSYINN